MFRTLLLISVFIWNCLMLIWTLSVLCASWRPNYKFADTSLVQILYKLLPNTNFFCQFNRVRMQISVLQAKVYAIMLQITKLFYIRGSCVRRVFILVPYFSQGVVYLLVLKKLLSVLIMHLGQSLLRIMNFGWYY